MYSYVCTDSSGVCTESIVMCVRTGKTHVLMFIAIMRDIMNVLMA